MYNNCICKSSIQKTILKSRKRERVDVDISIKKCIFSHFQPKLNNKFKISAILLSQWHYCNY